MRRAITLLLYIAAATLAHAAGFTTMMPKPLRLEQGAGREPLKPGLRVNIPAQSPARIREIAEVFAEYLKEQTSLACKLVSSDAIEPGAVTLILQTPSVAEACASESYSIEINEKGIVVAAASTEGLLWGVQTLLQGIEHENGQHYIRHASINDQPARAWRGLMLDPARSFLDLAFIRRTIRVMSAYKMNVLHLHLIDDQSWAFESRAFPKCNRPGEKYYTQDQLRELVKYAARYGVDVLPELDFPGHSHAEVAAYPQLDCEGKTRGMNDTILCAGKPFTWEFMEKVIAEVAAIFPSRYIHLGADEPFAMKRWKDCPDCQARMKARGVTTLESFYHTFVIDLNDIVKRNGRRLIVWNEAIHPGVAPMPPKDITIHAWTNYKNAQTMAAAGYTIINSSYAPLYLTSFGLRQGVALSAVKAWDATLFGAENPKPGAASVKYARLPPGALILGGQACMWATEQGLVEKRLYPRMLCTAETLWAEGRAGDLADFEIRWPAHERRLDKFGVSPEYKRTPGTLFDGKTSDLRSSEKKYCDFILTFELNTDETPVFSGFVLRDNFRLNVTPPAGHVLMRSLRALKGWHTYEVTARDSVISLTIDGCMAWSVSNADVRTGHIILQEAGKVNACRNITLRNLD
ncbi:MAG: family 20 glycosylhydrolase [Opitutaceae bacterium]|jgi:hexosaminidase|nr:family 20 glycosylhydrolase [Opitutaceae bacterium]